MKYKFIYLMQTEMNLNNNSIKKIPHGTDNTAGDHELCYTHNRRKLSIA